MNESITGHRGDRNNPAWGILESAVRDNRHITLTPEQCRDILKWANEVTEDKNTVVNDNHAMATRIAALEDMLKT